MEKWLFLGFFGVDFVAKNGHFCTFLDSFFEVFDNLHKKAKGFYKIQMSNLCEMFSFLKNYCKMFEVMI